MFVVLNDNGFQNIKVRCVSKTQIKLGTWARWEFPHSWTWAAPGSSHSCSLQGSQESGGWSHAALSRQLKKGANLGPNSLTCVSQVDQPRVLAQLSILTSHDSIEDKVPAARSRAAVELLLNLNLFQILTSQCSYNQGGSRTMAPEELGNFSGWMEINLDLFEQIKNPTCGCFSGGGGGGNWQPTPVCILYLLRAESGIGATNLNSFYQPLLWSLLLTKISFLIL